MYLTTEQAILIDQLREIGSKNKAVRTLLDALCEGLLIDGIGNLEIFNNQETIDVFVAARFAMAFIEANEKTLEKK